GPFGDGGFSFNFGNLPAGVLSDPAHDISDGFSVRFVLYGPIVRRGPVISANGVGEIPVSLYTGAQFVPVEIDLRRGGLLDVTFNGTKILANWPTGFQPRPGRFGFAGGLTAESDGVQYPGVAQWIDDVSIIVNREISYLNGPALATSV